VFPLVLAGNCNTAVGTLSGADPEGLGVVWFDAHGDFNTPETTTTGFIDGMGLAIAVGHCWKAMARGVSGFSPVLEENVVIGGSGRWLRQSKSGWMLRRLPLSARIVWRDRGWEHLRQPWMP
jgi:arginase family enzyme